MTCTQRVLSGMAYGMISRTGELGHLHFKEDLEAEGWIGYLTDSREEEYLRLLKAKDFMRDAWFKWRFGVVAGCLERNGPLQVADLDSFIDPGPSMEEELEVKDFYEKLIQRLKARKLPGLIETLNAMICEGRPHLRLATSDLGIKPGQNSYRKQVIQKEARELWES